MIQIVKFRAAHLQVLNLQKSQEYFRGEFGNPNYGLQLEASPYSFTGLVDDKVVGCAGVHELWQGRAVAWALLSEGVGPHMRSISRAALGFLAQAPWRRVEAMIDASFEPARRWAQMMGMQQEGLMRAYSPTGNDYYIYARIKNG